MYCTLVYVRVAAVVTAAVGLLLCTAPVLLTFRGTSVGYHNPVCVQDGTHTHTHAHTRTPQKHRSGRHEGETFKYGYWRTAAAT